jgi:hypothetical protein
MRIEIVKNSDSHNWQYRGDLGKLLKNNVLHLFYFVKNSDGGRKGQGERIKSKLLIVTGDK